MGVAVAARHGQWLGCGLRQWLCLGQGGLRAFALSDEAGLGVVEYAAVGEGLWCLTCDLAADGGIFASADLGLGRRDGPQAQGNDGAVQQDVKAGLFSHVSKRLGCRSSLRTPVPWRIT